MLYTYTENHTGDTCFRLSGLQFSLQPPLPPPLFSRASLSKLHPHTHPIPLGDDKLTFKYLLIECIGSNVRGVATMTRLTPTAYENVNKLTFYSIPVTWRHWLSFWGILFQRLLCLPHG